MVAVSAMVGETNRLLDLAYQVSGTADRREKDALTATGEQAVAALTAMAIQAIGGRARSNLGSQVRILTNATVGEARIQGIETDGLRAALARGEIPVVAGFQGVNPSGAITASGRGGSDTTAVALAAALDASCCEVYTDVDGIYAAGPYICANARKIDCISCRQMLSLAR